MAWGLVLEKKWGLVLEKKCHAKMPMEFRRGGGAVNPLAHRLGPLPVRPRPGGISRTPANGLAGYPRGRGWRRVAGPSPKGDRPLCRAKGQALCVGRDRVGVGMDVRVGRRRVGIGMNMRVGRYRVGVGMDVRAGRDRVGVGMNVRAGRQRVGVGIGSSLSWW